MKNIIHDVQMWDVSILQWIAKYFHSDLMDQMMPWITAMGDMGIIWIVLALGLLLIPKERIMGIQIICSLAFSYIFCNLIIKNIVQRMRPFEVMEGIELLIAAPHEFSFPSGHTSAAFAAVTILILNRWWGRHFAVIFAVLIAFSRLYLFVHYPTDVIAGVFVGIAVGILANRVCKKLLSENGVRREELL